MRLLPVVFAALFCASAAMAQDVATTGNPVAASADPAGADVASDPASPTAGGKHPRLTWEQHFAKANTTHDGHLTLDQAKAGYKAVARHFQEIDAGKKGYVTEDDVGAWHKARHNAHHAEKVPNGGRSQN